MVCLICGKKARHDTEQKAWVHQKTNKVECAKNQGICRPGSQSQYDKRPATAAELTALAEAFAK